MLLLVLVLQRHPFGVAGADSDAAAAAVVVDWRLAG